jgi:CpXC motif protein
MSSFNELDVTCEQCGEEFKGTVWTAIHAGEDPELKDLLQGGEFNLLMCPECSHIAYHDHFVLYQEPAAELVAYIYPLAQERDEVFLRAAMMTNFREAQAVYQPKDRKDYDPILVFGLETFVEMMQAEAARAEQSQIAQAICEERGIPYQLLRPSEARRLQSMRVIPGAKRDNAEIQKGIEQLLKINPNLDRYAKLAEDFSAQLT